MLKSARAIFFMLTAGFGTGAHAAGCEPGPNEVTLYQHSNYRGVCSVLGVGEYPDSAAMRMENDSVSSIKVGANVKIIVINHSRTRGNTSIIDRLRTGKQYNGLVEQEFTRSQPSLKGTRIGNDTISWVIVSNKSEANDFEHGDCYPGDNSYSIALYQHPNFKGDCRVLGLGTYRNSGQMNFKNDTASSVEFGRNSKVYVQLYSDSDFKGRTQTLSRSANFLNRGAVGDNKLTSIKVLRN